MVKDEDAATGVGNRSVDEEEYENETLPRIFSRMGNVGHSCQGSRAPLVPQCLSLQQVRRSTGVKGNAELYCLWEGYQVN